MASCLSATRSRPSAARLRLAVRTCSSCATNTDEPGHYCPECGAALPATVDPDAVNPAASLVGTSVVGLIKQTTRLKEDTALGMVLAAFFSIGIAAMVRRRRKA